MKKILLASIALAATAVAAEAQSAIDAYQLTPTDLRGSARFIGMGGAFTSLGGDISSLTQNPAGIGLYRKSDIGLTFDISIRKYRAQTESNNISINKTKAYFDNIGYIGAARLGGVMKYFQWGVSYNRLNSFDRITRGYNAVAASSLSNYVAGFTNGVNSDDLAFVNDGPDKYNPYINSANDWLSIIAFDSFMINNPGGDKTEYVGLRNGNTRSDALYGIKESGYVDEYNIAFGGNVSDILYWGFDIGIHDISYRREALYSESLENATIYSNVSQTLANGNAGFTLNNYKQITGTGCNLKFGLIVRPVEMFRIGVAVHTPTWYRLTHQGDANSDYSYFDPAYPEDRYNPLAGTDHTEIYDYDSRLHSPWRFMVGASVNIGSRAIISADYERVAYGDMTVKYQVPNAGYWGGSSFETDEDVKADIKDYFKAANIFRVGAEFRVTPRFSLRAGFSNQSSNVREAASSGSLQIFTAGTDPSFSFDKSIRNISFGLGYRYKAWYIDAAYQYKHRESTFHAYTNFDGNIAPQAKVTDNIHSIVISTGFRF